MACCAILLDAELNGKLIDNARHSKATCDLLHGAEALVSRLKQADAQRKTTMPPAPEPEGDWLANAVKRRALDPAHAGGTMIDEGKVHAHV